MKRVACAAGRLVRCLIPHSCVLCGDEHVAGCFCPDCANDLPRIGPACARCGVPLAFALPEGVPCATCQFRPPPFGAARAVLEYAYPVDAALKALKFRRRLHYAPAFAELLQPVLETEFPDVDALVPVPLHRRRHAMRGFNQASELCRPLRRRSGLPVVKNAMRTRWTRPQAGLSAAERRRNLRNAFTVSGRLACRHPLIVDDVMTTGETCRRLAAALLEAGAETVSVLAVARAGPVG